MSPWIYSTIRRLVFAISPERLPDTHLPTVGSLSLGSFNTNPGGDFGDWASSVGPNSYLAYSSPGVVDPVTSSDLALIDLLGWDPSSAGAPTVTVALAHDTGGTNNITSNDALTGTADANATVTLSQGSTVLGTTTANASGVWSFTPTGLAQVPRPSPPARPMPPV